MGWRRALGECLWRGGGAKYFFSGPKFPPRNSVSFLGLTEFRGANSVSSSQPIICVF